MYDVVIIGTGTAGITAAGILAKAGKKTAIVDNRPYGGTCALRGCQPKKFLVNNTHIAEETRALAGKGFSSPAITDWSQLQDFKRDFTSPVSEKTNHSLQMKGIDCYSGTVRFRDCSRITIDDDERELSSKAFIIASGSSAKRLNLKGSTVPPDSDDFLELDSLPESVIFIGGGYVSLEFAFIAALAGSRVTVLQNIDRFIPQFPESLLTPVTESAGEHGIEMISGVEVTAVKRTEAGYRISTAGYGDFDAEYSVAAIGRHPEIESLDLEAAGVSYDESGILTDKYMQCSSGNIYAAGDCVSSRMLAPVADLEAETAAYNIIDSKSRIMNYESVPSVVFTYPQMASVGMTREQAEAAGFKPEIKSGSGSGWPNYRRIDARHVYYETLTDPDSGRLLGAHIASPKAGEIINLFAYAMRHGLQASSLKELPWAYPTYLSDIKYMV